MTMQCVKEIVLFSNNSAETWAASLWDYIAGSVHKLHKKINISCHHLQFILHSKWIITADLTYPYLYFCLLHNQYSIMNLRLITPGIVSAFSCAPNGFYIILAVEEKIFIYQMSTGKLLRIISRHYQTITCLTFNADNSSFCSGGEDGLVFLWCLSSVLNNYNQSNPYCKLSDHTLPVKNMYLSNFGLMSRLITASLDRTARIYNASTGTSLMTLAFDVSLTSVCMDIKECNLFIGCSSGIIQRLNLHEPPLNNNVQFLMINNSAVFNAHSVSISYMSVSADCTSLLSGSSDGMLNLWNIHSQQIINTISCESSVNLAVFIPIYTQDKKNNLKYRNLFSSFDKVGKENEIKSIIEVLNVKNKFCLLNEVFFLRDKIKFVKSNDQYWSKAARKYRVEIERLKEVNFELYHYVTQYLIAQNPPEKYNK